MDIEKLGYFYLGRRYDSESRRTLPEPVMYDSRDLTTHAVCIGMTGSGKTGLCIALLEEAAIDGIPAIAIDPKGDLGNLLLTFPDLNGESFRPWIDESEAARAGVTPDEQASRTAERWRAGLAAWGQDGARIRRLRSAVETRLFTPGSTAGRPLNVLGCLSHPGPEVMADPEHLADRVEAAAASLLSLLGIAPDPLRSREHVLLATLLHHAWAGGGSLTLEDLILGVQRPPFDRIGALPLESFYPEKERFELAIAMNNLLASPSFSCWGAGEPLDAASLLFSHEGKPQLSVVSIAHLDERERMFVVSLLLNEVLSWVRRQPGSQSLRALLYMDEVFGFLPPSASPPSKKPLLTLLKQARAHGVGVVLATQNPVDLDYKALSNAGTWFLGRLQTERDKQRVLDGLDTLGSRGPDRARLDSLLSSLGKRIFLMHDVHEDGPILLESRWALSYLAGPLSRDQIARLCADGPTHAEATADLPTPSPALPSAAGESPAVQATRPVLEPGIDEAFAAGADESPVEYRPTLLGRARLHFVYARAAVDRWESVSLIGEVAPGGAAWEHSVDAEGLQIRTGPVEPARFRPLPACGAQPTSYKTWARALASHLHRDRKLPVWHCPVLRAWSRPDESKAEFAARVDALRRESRDEAVERVRQRYASKTATLVERIRRAEQRVEREQEQYRKARDDTAISLGATLLGTLFGRKVGSAGTLGRATSTMRGAGRAAQQRADVEHAREDLESLKQQLDALEREARSALEEIAREYEAAGSNVEVRHVAPRKSDIEVDRVTLLWLPVPPQ